MGQGWPFQSPALSLAPSVEAQFACLQRSPPPHLGVSLRGWSWAPDDSAHCPCEQTEVSLAALLNAHLPPASGPLLQVSPESGLSDGSWRAGFPLSALPLPLGLLAHVQEPARGSSAERKSGAGWAVVSGRDEGTP